MGCNNCGGGTEKVRFGKGIMWMYTDDLINEAEANWLPSHIQMLKRLIASVMLMNKLTN